MTMSNGFLNDLPDLDMPGKKRKKKSPGAKDQLVRYIRCRCPKCNSIQVPVQHTNPEVDGNIIRHHKCLDCGHTFKSIEENYQAG
ncbi:hypothetical protein ES703_75872 [subsurface metagenome]